MRDEKENGKKLSFYILAGEKGLKMMRYGKIIGLFLLCVMVSLTATAQDGKNKKEKKANNDPWAEYEQTKDSPAPAEDVSTGTGETEEKPAEEVKKDVSAEKKKADKADKKGKKTEEKVKEGKEEGSKTVTDVKAGETISSADSVATDAKAALPVNTAADSTRSSQDAMAAYNKALAAQNIKRPVVKQADIKDPVERKLKGPSGQTVYTSAKGGKYYINNIGVKTFLSGKE